MLSRKTIATRITLSYFLWWVQWIVMQVFVVHYLGFDWIISASDSLVNNILLIAAGYTTNNVMRFYHPLKWQWYYGLIWNIVITGICIAMFNWIQEKIFPGNTAYLDFISQSVPVRFCFSLLMVMSSSMISWIWYQLIDQQEKQTRKADLEKLVKESELIKLRQQLQPHFLFNSLNSISALTGSKPEEARKMIQQLSDFLRGTLKKDDQQFVTLEDELNHLQLYLDIEKVRFGHRLNIIVDAGKASRKMMMPSLLLQPIVENAVKFGLYDTIGETQISIKTTTGEGYLLVEIQNPFDRQTARPKPGTGFGLSSVERRLYLLFGRSDLLETKSEGNTFITFVKIQQEI